MGYFIDIQGTLLSDIDYKPIKGSIEFLNYLNSNKIPFALITNNTLLHSQKLKMYLRNLGFNFDENSYIDPFMIIKNKLINKKIAAFGSENFITILKEMNFDITYENPDIVLLSSSSKFDFENFSFMIKLIQKGAKLVAMHKSSIFVKNEKKYPGVGAIVKMLEFACATKAKIIGKPTKSFYKQGLSLLRTKDKKLKFSDIIMLSDDAIGDLVGAKKLNIKTYLLLSGKTKNIDELGVYKKYIDKTYNNISEWSDFGY